ncbi:hypothetical protein GCM10023231_12650 [Olivibacter ginsenosidimutans]|uniref:PIN domain-containing protein n=1 Tax=Olivibacter ginsenosidimutans TaxID=1176537 RepID=A0ABP9AVB7_9SPHI
MFILLPEKGHQLIANIIDQQPIISVTNQIELSSLMKVPPAITNFLALADIIQFNHEIVDETIRLRKKYKIKLPDAIIAASTLTTGCTLITHNLKDFANIKGLKVIDSYSGDL